MSGGLLALFDDIAVLAKGFAATADDVAAGAMKASAKSAGLIVDDAAVTPKYLTGMTPAQELPVIWKIMKASFFNKLVIVLPVILLLSWLAPFLLPFILIVGGCYLAIEGSEKVYEWVTKTKHESNAATDEKTVVANTTRTDLVLSFEIMLISLTAVNTTDWGVKAGILVAVAILMTILVYGSVAILIKMDDIGLWMTRKTKSMASRRVGLSIIKAMPVVFQVIGVVGTLAMLWVGGHILMVSLKDIGVPFLYEGLNHVTGLVAGAGGLVVWLVDAALSGIFGLIIGMLLLPVWMKISHALAAKKKKKKEAEAGEALKSQSSSDSHAAPIVVTDGGAGAGTKAEPQGKFAQFWDNFLNGDVGGSSDGGGSSGGGDGGGGGE